MASRSSRAGPLAFPNRIPFVEEVGLELWSAAGGQSELRLPLDAGHMNSNKRAHGGVLMTLLDVAMAQSARSLHRTGESYGPSVTTIEMKTSFVHPANGELCAKGRVLHRTRTMAFCEASVFDLEGQLCAHATGTFKYLRASPERPVPSSKPSGDKR